MREIEFKAKRVDDGVWVYGYYCELAGRKYIIPDYSQFRDIHDADIEYSFTEIIPETVCQWTGLLDKHGTKIFEGDILKMHQFLFDGNEYEKETIGVIKWGEYGWLLSQIDGKEVNEYMGYKNGEGETYLIHFYGLHEESFEIIGNIHDKAQQKQRLIDMMRWDEEIGLYDDNPKNHGYER